MADSGPGHQSHQPVFETQPDQVGIRPEFETLPDYVEVDPERPDIEIPDWTPPSLEELKIALQRAQLVLEDVSTLLQPALQAMQDGAWVSRKADEFSTGLTTHAGIADSTAQSCVDAIQEAIDTRSSEPIDPMPRPL